MAYDLLFRKQIPSNFSREGAVPGAIAGGVGIIAAIALIVIPRAKRRAENARCRIEYAHDYYGDTPRYELARTQELPAIPMNVLMQSKE